MYAWSRFPVESDEWGKITRFIEPGDKISQSDLSVSDDDWAEIVAAGAVRDEPYPDIPNNMSPAEYWRAHPDEAPDNAEPSPPPKLKVEEVKQSASEKLASVLPSKKEEPTVKDKES